MAKHDSPDKPAVSTTYSQHHRHQGCNTHNGGHPQPGTQIDSNPGRYAARYRLYKPEDKDIGNLVATLKQRPYRHETQIDPCDQREHEPRPAPDRHLSPPSGSKKNKTA